MAEEGSDDYEMEDLGRKYPEYDDLNEQDLDDEYDNLLKNRLHLLRNDNNPQYDINKRINYIERIKENKFGEATFINNKDGRTVIGSTSGIINPENKKNICY